MTELDRKYDIVDEPTPPNAPLSAKYKRSFAYYTIQERLPIILTKIIDQTTRDKDELADMFNGEETKDDVKEVIANLSQLKYELQTNKELSPLIGNEVDKDVWNTFIEQLGENNTYFSTKWLYAECYLYRRLKSIFEQTKSLKEYDYFRKQKDAAFTASLDSMKTVLDATNNFYHSPLLRGYNEGIDTSTLDRCSYELLEKIFNKLLRINLWGNRCDLSISNGREVKQTGNPFDMLPEFESCILADQSRDIWVCLKAAAKPKCIDIVMDNAGYELFTDLVLADFFLRFEFVGKVRFHCKAIPWFISDVMYRDFYWTVDAMLASNINTIKQFGQRIDSYIRDGQIDLQPIEYFWTSPYEYQALQRINPKLYEKLATSHLIIFKGDLNYRKLFGDTNWPFGARFTDVLGVFRPTNLCSLRTVKADIICELPDGVNEELTQLDKMWMETGKYGVIHFAPKPNKLSMR